MRSSRAADAQQWEVCAVTTHSAASIPDSHPDFTPYSPAHSAPPIRICLPFCTMLVPDSWIDSELLRKVLGVM